MIRFSEALQGTNLNSVWLEGILVDNPVDLKCSVPPACRFRVRAPRPPERPSVFLVEADESALDGCRARLVRGRTVRIIGRLRQHRWTDVRGRPRDTVQIVSELVEPVAAGR